MQTQATKATTPVPTQPEVDKKAERLARLEAWKKKMESKGKEKTEEANKNQNAQAEEPAWLQATKK